MSEADEKSVDRLQQEAILYREEFQRRGVIYMSRVPPFMKPNKAKSMFEQYGEVTRLYLAEEGIYNKFNSTLKCKYKRCLILP